MLLKQESPDYVCREINILILSFTSSLLFNRFNYSLPQSQTLKKRIHNQLQMHAVIKMGLVPSPDMQIPILIHCSVWFVSGV